MKCTRFFFIQIELIEPKYINSTFNLTVIESLFYLPGIFNRFIVQLSSRNQTCSIDYSRFQSPLYRCVFKNLPPAQWFILNFHILTPNQRALFADVMIVHTG